MLNTNSDPNREIVPHAPPIVQPKPRNERDAAPSTADVLNNILSKYKCFVGTDGEAYAVTARRDSSARSDTIRIRDPLFAMKLREEYYHVAKRESYKAKHLTEAAVESALASCEALARYDPGVSGSQLVFKRVAGVKDENGQLSAIYIDLGVESGEYIRVSKDGWGPVDSLPDGIHIVRTPTQLPLPRPDPDGTLADLSALLRTRRPAETLFICAWLIMCFHPYGPYPVLMLQGPAGSGKSFLMRQLVRLTDNREAKARRPFKSSEDLAIHAKRVHVVALENVSFVSSQRSDDLCSIATGAAFGGRELYTNTGEVAFKVCRPIVMNGITNFVTRQDLLSRLLAVHMQPISPTERKTESQLQADIEGVLPRIMGGVMNALAEALRHPNHVPEELSRMADFVAFIDRTQGSPPDGINRFPEHLPNILDAMKDLDARTVSEAVESSGVATAFIRHAEEQGPGTHEGTMTDWLHDLSCMRSDEHTWPATARALQAQLASIDGILRASGVSVYPKLSADGVQQKTYPGRRAIYVLEYAPPENDAES